MITLMWAMDINRVIGLNDTLPWHYKVDMAYFKKHAYHTEVLMGYQTYLSMLTYFPSKKLPFKKVYIASRKQSEIENAEIIHDLIPFLEERKEDLMIIGGAQIYQIAFPYANALRITYVLKPYVGDTYFPKYHLEEFKLISYSTDHELILSHYERVKK